MQPFPPLVQPNLCQEWSVPRTDCSRTSPIRLLAHPLHAGFPSPAADYAEDSLDLNTFLIRRPAATFMFSVVGDSMTGAGIEDGDKVVVDRSVSPSHRHIVVAVVDGEYTLKRLVFDAEGRPELHAENPAFPSRRFGDDEQLEVWGVVVGVVRRYD